MLGGAHWSGVYFVRDVHRRLRPECVPPRRTHYLARPGRLVVPVAALFLGVFNWLAWPVNAARSSTNETAGRNNTAYGFFEKPPGSNLFDTGLVERRRRYGPLARHWVRDKGGSLLALQQLEEAGILGTLLHVGLLRGAHLSRFPMRDPEATRYLGMGALAPGPLGPYIGSLSQNRALLNVFKESPTGESPLRRLSGYGSLRIFPGYFNAYHVRGGTYIDPIPGSGLYPTGLELFGYQTQPYIVLGGGPAGAIAAAALRAVGIPKENITVVDEAGAFGGRWRMRNFADLHTNNDGSIRVLGATLEAGPVAGHKIAQFLDHLTGLQAVPYEFFSYSLPPEATLLNDPLAASVLEVIPGDLDTRVRLRHVQDGHEFELAAPVVINALGTPSPRPMSDRKRMTTPVDSSAVHRYPELLDVEQLLPLQDQQGGPLFVGLGNATAQMLVQIESLNQAGIHIDYRVLTHFSQEMLNAPDLRHRFKDKRRSLFRDPDLPELSGLAGDSNEIRAAVFRARDEGTIIPKVTHWEIVDQHVLYWQGRHKPPTPPDGHFKVAGMPYVLTGYETTDEQLGRFGMIKARDGAPAVDWDGEVQRALHAPGRDRLFAGYYGVGSVLARDNEGDIAGIIHKVIAQAVMAAFRGQEAAERALQATQGGSLMKPVARTGSRRRAALAAPLIGAILLICSQPGPAAHANTPTYTHPKRNRLYRLFAGMATPQSDLYTVYQELAHYATRDKGLDPAVLLQLERHGLLTALIYSNLGRIASVAAPTRHRAAPRALREGARLGGEVNLDDNAYYLGTLDQNEILQRVFKDNPDGGHKLRQISGEGAVRFYPGVFEGYPVDFERIVRTGNGFLPIGYPPMAYQSQQVYILGAGPAGALVGAALRAAGFSRDQIQHIDRNGQFQGIWGYPHLRKAHTNNPFDIGALGLILERGPEPGHLIEHFIQDLVGRQPLPVAGSRGVIEQRLLNDPIPATVLSIDPGDLNTQVEIRHSDDRRETLNAPIVINTLGTPKPRPASDPSRITTNFDARGSRRWQPLLDIEWLKHLADGDEELFFVGLGNSTAEPLIQIYDALMQDLMVPFRVATHYPQQAVFRPDQTVIIDGREWRLFRDLEVPVLTGLSGDLGRVRQAFEMARDRGRIMADTRHWDLEGNEVKVWTKDRDPGGPATHRFTIAGKPYILIGYTSTDEDLSRFGLLRAADGAPAYDFDGEVQRTLEATVGRKRVWPGYFILGALMERGNAIVIPGMLDMLLKQIPSIIMRAQEAAIRAGNG